MQGVIIAILATLCAVLAFRQIGVEQSIRAGVKQLRQRRESGSTARIDMAMPSHPAEELLAAVNRLSEAHAVEKMEFRKQEQALRRQIANVSHDLRTPLTSISGYIQLLQNENLTDEERQEYLAVIESRAKTLGTLIGTFYDLSRIESGDYPLVMEQVDLAPLLRRLLAESWSDFADANVVVDADLQDDAPLVQADEKAVLRIFSNLLGNASRHAVGCLRVCLTVEGSAVLTTFSNPAGNLTEEDAAHVFERSYTADKMRSGQNTGLGLAIVKALAERMGHAVYATLDKGMFTVGVRWSTADLR
ncbi:MAG: HAMP domain-containing histidine kinase [Oscillospiraceae bacterium]|nr:HAMP domain-containing histidine kinase [Oscillospiraceae bacterium]